MVQPKAKYAVPALDKAFEILEFMAKSSVAKSQIQIAQGVGRSANEIYRILVNLEQSGYLLRDLKSGHYRLSMKLYNLSRSISPIDQVRQCALPLMEDLVVEVGYSSHLCMLYQSQTMVIVHARSHQPVSLNVAEGALFSTLSSNSGRVLLANSNAEVREMILEREPHFGHYSNSQKQQLYQELADIRQRGYLSSPSLTTQGVYDFVTLVGEPEGKVIASLAVSSLNNELMHGEYASQVQQKVLLSAQKISQNLM